MNAGARDGSESGQPFVPANCLRQPLNSNVGVSKPMSDSAIQPPTRAVLAACDALDTVIVTFLNSRGSANQYAQYSSTVEALNLFNLVVRNVEGVLAMARHDMVLLPAAFACARAALETAAKAAWMVDANDPFVRETRWLSHLQEEERVYERSAKRYAEGGKEHRAFTDRASQLNGFRAAVESKLPAGVQPLKHNPTMEEILASLQGKQLYPLYIYLSQFVHGGHAATWLYRRGLGTESQTGEYFDPMHWHLPFRVCWLSLSQPGSLLLWRLGSGSKTFMPATVAAKAAGAIERVNSSIKRSS